MSRATHTTCFISDRPGQCLNHLIDDLIRELPHLGVGSVLYRVLHETTPRLESERLALDGGGFFELGRYDRHGRNAVDLEVHRVMQTARGTRTSVGERLDDE